MNKYKITLAFAALSIFGSLAFADSDSVSSEAKLALLVSNPQRLEQVTISASDAADLKAEKNMDGDNGSSSTYVKVQVNGQNKIYIISKDGYGQMLSMKLLTRKKDIAIVEKLLTGN